MKGFCGPTENTKIKKRIFVERICLTCCPTSTTTEQCSHETADLYDMLIEGKREGEGRGGGGAEELCLLMGLCLCDTRFGL